MGKRNINVLTCSSDGGVLFRINNEVLDLTSSSPLVNPSSESEDELPAINICSHRYEVIVINYSEVQ